MSSQNNWSNWLNLVKNFYVTNQISPLFTTLNHDSRLYLDIIINNRITPALLDTGATQSVLGKSMFQYIVSSNVRINYDSCTVTVTTADGQSQKVIGSVDLPITLDNVEKSVNFLIVPSIKHNVILGIDFCKIFDLRVYFDKGTYHSTSKTSDNKNSLTSNLEDPSNFQTCSLTTECNLNNVQTNKLNSVVAKFKELDSSQLGLTHLCEHKIELTSNEPFKQRAFPLSPYMQNHMNNEIDRLLKQNVIRPSKSPYSSNVLLVKKSSGEYRLCFDGRRLNSITKPDRYPLPNLESVLTKVRNAKFLSSIDLRQAFFQVRLTDDSCEKTAFQIIGRGLFEFVRMPFGLTNSAQTLQRLIDRLFDPTDIESNVFTYLDDLVIVNDDFDKHVDTLLQVFEILKSAGLTVNLEKCKFCKASLSFLGYVIDKDGLHSNPDKVSAICDFPRPQTTTEVKRFIGMASWYRKFIKNFSELINPLNKLLKNRKKGQKIIWTSEANISFENLKTCLSTAPVLTNPDFSKLFTIQTDASDVAVGSVLTQGEGDDERVIAYASRSLSKAERSYTTTERELLSIIFSVNKFLSYIQGVNFRVITDHSSLLWLHRLRNPTGRLARWAAYLSQFNIEFKHRSGKLNVIPDALSRAPVELNVITIDNSKLDPWYQKMIKKVLSSPPGM